MVSLSGVATIAVGRQRGAVELERHQIEPVAVERPAAPPAICGLGLSASVARTLVCVGCSETSSETVSTSQSGGR